MIQIPNEENSKGKIRGKMPQITKKDLPDLLRYLEDKLDYRITEEKIDPNLLIPSQKNFNEDKVNNLAKNPDLKDRKIIISKDNYVLDGHHTWLAIIAANIKEINVIRIHSNVDECLQSLNEYPKSFNKNVNEMLTFIEFIERKNARIK